MAASMLSALTRRVFRSCSVLSSFEQITHCTTITGCHGRLSPLIGITSITVQRDYSFFTNLTANDLWSGATGVSSVGKKRGRGKKARRKIDLNFGKKVGHGKKKVGYTGLNVRIDDINQATKNVMSLRKLSDREIQPSRVSFQKRGKFRKLLPLERGWTGRRLPGVNVGAPDPIGDYQFKGFKTVLLETKLVSTMTSVLKKKPQQFALVVTGNGNGLAGHAIGKGPKMNQAIRSATNKAAQRLQFVERFESHTVYHNFYSKLRSTAVLVKRKERGFGLKCHRAVKEICQLVGIKDLHVKVIGRINMHNIVRAMFKGLRKQESHQDLADRMKLHLVEYRPERGNIPIVVASPSHGQVKEVVENKEKLDFEQMFYGGKRELEKPKKQIFFYNNPAYHKKKRVLFKRRNQPQAQTERKMCGLEPSIEDRKKALLIKKLQSVKN